MLRWMRVFTTAVLIAAPAQAASPQALPAAAAACAVPNVGARTLHTVTPEIPEMAQQVGVAGTVVLVVRLDEYSHLTSVTIQSSPSMILVAAAMSAARHSAFQTSVQDCKPQAASFTFPVVFGHVPSPFPDGMPIPQEARTAYFSGEGTATLPADLAYVHVEFAVRDADRATAIARSDAAFESFRGKLAALSLTGSETQPAFYNVLAEGATFAEPRRLDAYAADHEVIVTVPQLARVREVVTAASAAGATTISVRFSVKDRERLYQAALRAATNNAEAVASQAATQSRRILGAVVATQTTRTSSDRLEPGTLVTVRGPGDELPPPVAELSARVTVTYALR